MHSRLVTPSNRRYVLAALALGVLSMAAHSATGDAVDGTHSAAVTQEMTPFLDAHQGSESLQSLVAMLKDLISATFPELEVHSWTDAGHFTILWYLTYQLNQL